MVSAENKYGIIAPIKIPGNIVGSNKSKRSIFAAVTYAANKAKAVKMAEPIAKPLPVAAVVLPKLSKASVR